MGRVDRVFIDTNELVPFTVMDVLLTLSEERLFDWVWTDKLLEEWERVVVREQRPELTGTYRSDGDDPPFITKRLLQAGPLGRHDSMLRADHRLVWTV